MQGAVTKNKKAYWKEKTISEQISGKQKGAIGALFKLLQIIGIRETRNLKGVQQARSVRKATIKSW